MISLRNFSQCGFIVLSSIFIIAMSVGLYQKLGQPSYLSLHKNDKAMEEMKNTLLHHPDKVIAALTLKVQQHPSAQGFYLLGKLYLDMQDLPHAINALTEALQWDPKRSDIATLLFTAYYDKHQRFLETYDALLATQSQNDPDVLALYGQALYQQKHYALAVEKLEKLLNFVDPDSQIAKAILATIAKAQQQLNCQQKHLSCARTLKIMLSTLFREKAQHYVTLFIFVKTATATESNLPPLLVSRWLTADLPKEILLDNTDAILPSRVLMPRDKLVVAVRMSRYNDGKMHSDDILYKAISCKSDLFKL